jgi:hypothetical protein
LEPLVLDLVTNAVVCSIIRKQTLLPPLAEPHQALAGLPQLEQMVLPQTQHILSWAVRAVVAVVLLVHLAQPHAQVAQAVMAAAVLLVAACIFMLHQRLPSLVLLVTDLLVCRAVVAARVGQSLLQAEAQQPTMPLH